MLRPVFCLIPLLCVACGDKESDSTDYGPGTH